MGMVKFNKITGKLNQLRKKMMYGPRYSTESYIRRMNQMGARIDESVGMATPESVFLDDTAPYLLEIGRNVFIAAGVKILTHDACWMVTKCNDGVVRGHMAPVRIGNNVFLGMNSVVLCNVTICDNVIIGANSVVSTHIREPGLYNGNPARLVATYEAYVEMLEGRQVREAYTIAARYYERFHEKPDQELFGEYFWIFAPRKLELLPERFLDQMKLCGNYEKTVKVFLESEPDFDGFDAFWDWCLKKIDRKRKKDADRTENSKG